MTRLPVVTPPMLRASRAGQLDLPLELPAGPPLLLLGQMPSEGPLRLSLFRERPVRVAIMGPPWVSVLLAIRAGMLGALVVVRTADPRRWQRLAQAAMDTSTPVIVQLPEQPVAVAGSREHPLMIINDGVPPMTMPMGAWQVDTELWESVPPSRTALADVVLLHRAGQPVAAAMERLLGLPALAAWLLRTPDDALAVIATGTVAYAHITVAPNEQALLT